MWNAHGVKRPREDDKKQQQEQGKENTSKHPPAGNTTPARPVITDWKTAWKQMDNGAPNNTHRYQICDNEHWEIWRYRSNDSTNNASSIEWEHMVENISGNERDIKTTYNGLATPDFDMDRVGKQ